MHKSLRTSYANHSLPTNNSVDNNFHALWSISKTTTINPLWTTSIHFEIKFVNFYVVFKPKKNDNLLESVEIPTISWNLYPSFINSEHNKI